MAWQQNWDALATRIERMIRLGEYTANALKVNAGDSFSVVRKRITPEIQHISSELRQFYDNYSIEISPLAAKCLKEFLDDKWFTTDGAMINANLLSVAALAAFRSEFEYLLRD